MKKQLLASLFSLLLLTGFAPIAFSTTSNNTPCCSGPSDCPMDKSSSCAYKVLTKEECQRFCQAKAAAIAKDPSLAQPENKCKLCRSIVQQDPSMKPICMKLRKHCRKMKKQGMNNSCGKMDCNKSSTQENTPKPVTSNASSQATDTATSSAPSTTSGTATSEMATDSNASSQENSSTATP